MGERWTENEDGEEREDYGVLFLVPRQKPPAQTAQQCPDLDALCVPRLWRCFGRKHRRVERIFMATKVRSLARSGSSPSSTLPERRPLGVAPTLSFSLTSVSSTGVGRVSRRPSSPIQALDRDLPASHPTLTASLYFSILHCSR